MTTTKRDWVRTIGITGATLVLAGGLTLGGLKIAEATGYVTLPTRGGHMMGPQQGSGFGKDRTGGFGMGQRGGRSHGHEDGMMGGFGAEQGPTNGRGMMDGSGADGMMQFGQGQTQATGDAQIVQHVLMMLQDEQLSAAAIGTSESAAKAIATTRATELAAVQAFQTQWYPAAEALPTTAKGSATTIDELRQELLHHSQMLEQINASATIEHPELAAWVKNTLAKRATEITTLYSK